MYDMRHLCEDLELPLAQIWDLFFPVGCGYSDCTSYYVNNDHVRLAMFGTGLLIMINDYYPINHHYNWIIMILIMSIISCFFNRNCFGER